MRFIGLFLCAVLLFGCREEQVQPVSAQPTEQSFPVLNGTTRRAESLITGRVVGVHDGDTITVFRQGQPELKVRLGEIDAPELGQPFGQDAKQMLSGMVFNQTVSVDITDTDRYGRGVGRIYVGSLDVNALMVQRGGAWAYRDYLEDETLLDDETAAQQAKIGLWGPNFDQGRMPPWEWRRNRRAPQRSVAPSSTPSGCEKTRCSQMTSCAEARHHLEVCRVPTLDGNGDGVPCESLCRP